MSSRLNANVTHTKCRASASLLPNNLSSSGAHLVYVHRNEVHLVKDGSLGTERGAVAIMVIPSGGSNVEARVSAIKQCVINGAPLVIVGTETGDVHVMCEKTQQRLCSGATGHQGGAARITSICVDSKVIYVGTGAGELVGFVYETGSLGKPQPMKAHSGPVTALAFDRGTLITGDQNGTIGFWQNGKMVGSVKGSGHPCLSLTAGHGYAVGGFSTGHLRMFNLTNKTLHVEITAHTRAINAVTTHLSQPMICCCSEDSFVSCWSLPSGEKAGVKALSSFSPGSAAMTGVAFCSGGKAIGAIAYDSRYISTVPAPGS